MDVPGGFTGGFSFYYSAPFGGGGINVWSGLNDTGTLLTTLTLPDTPDSGDPGCNGLDYCPFAPIGVTFSGTAESVDFGGTENHIAFDNITLGSATPAPSSVPEPASLGLLALGFSSLVVISQKRRKPSS